MKNQRLRQKAKPLGLILAGGLSKRLYPVLLPKPLMRVGKHTLLEEALGRLDGFEKRVIVNPSIAKMIRKHFPKKQLSSFDFFLEPVGRDTAAAIGFGLRSATKLKPSWVAVLSADQWMPETKKFSNFLKVVEKEIEKFPNALFVAGSPQESKPKNSHSQFGWIYPELNEASQSFPVKKFVEKPQGDTLEMMRSVGALINAGMFFGKYETFCAAYERHYPQVLDKKFPFQNLIRQPVDRAIFERYEEVRVVPLSLQWEDLGTWEDWHEQFLRCPERHQTNKIKKTALRTPSESAEKIFVSAASLLSVDIFGLDDLAIVEREGRLIVMPLSKTRELKTFLEAKEKSDL